MEEEHDLRAPTQERTHGYPEHLHNRNAALAREQRLPAVAVANPGMRKRGEEEASVSCSTQRRGGGEGTLT